MHDPLALADADLDALLTRLESNNEPLTPRDVELVARALRALAADQLLILRMQRLLALHGESAERLDAILLDAHAALDRRADSGPPAEGFDPHAADVARAALAQRVDDARTGRDVILAALAFARDLFPPAAAAPFGRR